MGRLDSVEWTGGLEHWTGMMEWWAGTSNKLGSSIAVIDIVTIGYSRKAHSCMRLNFLSWGLNYLQLANT